MKVMRNRRGTGGKEPGHPSCSLRPHDQNVLAWASDASRRVEGGRVRRSRSEGPSGCSPESEAEKVRCRAGDLILESLIDTC
jgi:hypothetical protein